MSKKLYWNEKFEDDGLYLVSRYDGYEWNYSLVAVKDGVVFAPFEPQWFHKVEQHEGSTVPTYSA